MKNLEWRKHARTTGLLVADTVTGDQCAVGTATKGEWYYRIGHKYYPYYETAKQAQDACNAKHKRLIGEWVIGQ